MVTLERPTVMVEQLSSLHGNVGHPKGSGREGVLVCARHVLCHSEDVANDCTLLISTAETIEVPYPKRIRVIGAGGHRIKALVAETGK